MTKVQELSQRKVPIVAIDTALDEYEGRILFPEKLERANTMLKTAKLPPKKHRNPFTFGAREVEE